MPGVSSVLAKSMATGMRMTLMLAPLTGKVAIKNGPVALVIPTDDFSASERWMFLLALVIVVAGLYLSGEFPM